MVDVFISYAREDREAAKKLAHALEVEGYSVWWDPVIPPGKKWAEVIGTQLGTARCVVVLWSAVSVAKRWVRKEANFADARNKLIPAKLEDVTIPFEFADVQAGNLGSWEGDTSHDGFQQLVSAISEQLRNPPSEQTEEDIVVATKQVEAQLAESQRTQGQPIGEKLKAAWERFRAYVGLPDRQTLLSKKAIIIGGVSVVLLVSLLSIYYIKKYYNIPLKLDTFKDCTECPEMVVIPAGSFTMGSPANANEPGRDPDEGPQHPVTIEPFAIGKTEVTFAEWDACVTAGGCNDYKPPDQGWGRGSQPVINVSWKDAKAYVSWLSQRTGKPYRLPSEAEWEYAARAGTRTRYSFGDALTPKDANYSDSKLDKTTEVGAHSNAWGLYDMHGNVWEWVEDIYHDSYQGAPADGTAWIDSEGENSSRGRVVRGGSWIDLPRMLRSANRTKYEPDDRNDHLGFRVSRAVG
jgi:formylglycine-generating enzyme required for sulfatase activity